MNIFELFERSVQKIAPYSELYGTILVDAPLDIGCLALDEILV